jgi:FlaA1/EpsC-like NDP-sugar epimerase
MTDRAASPLIQQFSQRSFLVFLFDLGAVAVGWLAAFVLRFNLSLPAEYALLALESLAWVLPIYAIVFLFSGLYRGLWQFASLPDMLRIVKTIAVGSTIVALAAYLLQLGLPIPRTVMLLSPMLLAILMGGARAAYRVWRERQRFGDLIALGKPVLILGAGRAGASLVRELQASSEWRVAGLLDDDDAKRGLEILGCKVLGRFDELERIGVGLHVRHAIIAIPEGTAAERQRAANLCVRAGVRGLTLPTIEHLIDGRVSLSNVRQINLEDLLGRDPVWIDSEHVRRLLERRTVLVTGAGGSIGSELCRQVARFGPGRIVFFEQSEFALYKLTEEFAAAFPEIDRLALIGDVTDEARVDEVIRDTRPSIIFHAAAYKHVPLMEENNAWQAVRNNVLGTHVVAAAAAHHAVERFVLVSTDKAINPTNVMGASKRLAEIVCQGLQPRAVTQMVVVRFGNVLGSAGSVIPKFQEQVANGGPVTVTHPEVTRYFMSIPEASQLVLQAAAMGEGGQIYVMEMGEPVRIADLARNIIRLSGFTDEQIRIEFTGLRAGEKLVEEVVDAGENELPTPHPKLRVVNARPVNASALDTVLAEIRRVPTASDGDTRRLLERFVPEYCRPDAISMPMAVAAKAGADSLEPVASVHTASLPS